MNCKFDQIIFNGKKIHYNEIKAIISAMHNPAIIAEKGGYLFKASLIADCLHLGVIPYFINGHRAHHYDIIIKDDKITLVGFINSNSSINMLIKLTQEDCKNGLSCKDKCSFSSLYTTFAKFLIDYGYPSNIELDIASKMLMNEAGFFCNCPETLKELSISEFDANTMA